MVFSLCILPASAKSADNNIYRAGKTEVVNINGVNYTYHYSLENGIRKIEVTEENSNKTDIVTYNESNSTIYLNGRVVGTGGAVIQSRTGSNTSSSSPYGEYIGSFSHRVTWGEGVSVGVVAACIAAGCGFLGAGAIIALFGYTALSGLAFSSVGGTVYGDIYILTGPESTLYTYIWSFTAWTGDSYGPFTTCISE